MEYNMFPPEYKKRIEQQLAEKNEEERSKAQSQMDSRWKKSHGKWLGKKLWQKWTWWGGCVGCAVGFLPCSINLIKGFVLFATFEETLFLWINYTLFGLIAGLVLGIIADIMRKRKKADLDKALDLDNQEYNDRLAENRKNYNQQYSEYEQGFDRQVKAGSLKFVGSQNVELVVNTLSSHICKLIANANRKSHIERISVSWEFTVCKDAIEYSGADGTEMVIDFEKNRFVTLSNPVDQAALARAVANELRVSVGVEYARDPSGTVGVLNIKESYTDTAVVVTVCYTAPNGNYRTTEKW